MTHNPLIPEFQIAKLELQPGDVLVVKCDQEITNELAERLKQSAECVLPDGVKAMVIGLGIELERLTRAEIEERVA